MTIEERIQAAGGGWAGAYVELTKPGITGFVALTAVASYLVAALPDIVYFDLFHLVLGTSLSTAGSLALNQYLERAPDGVMIRTRGRPVPSGRIPEAHARFFGWVLLLAGVGHIWFWLGWLPALVTAVAALLYDAVYTPLKLRSPLATPVGAVPGALPVLIGWTAHTGNIDARGVTLFGILFLWQLIHVLALGWNLRADYERAGFQLIPPGSAGLVAGLMVGYAALLALVSTLPTVLGMAGNAYLGAAILLGAGMIAVSVAFLRNPTRQNCNRVFVGSLLYHPLLLGTMVAGAF
ncbi:MAG: heme o synthase [Gemmatimonadota bacterium]|nr:heme o synthase [Gemmatimonadota bacterium]